MEVVYKVFHHLKDPNHRLKREDYFITIFIYNIIVHLFAGIVFGGMELITRGQLELSNIMGIVIFLMCLPLYSSHYHRLLDTGMSVKYAKLVPIVGCSLKTISLILPFITNYDSSGFFGSGTLRLLTGLYLDPDANFYMFTAIFIMIQALYMLFNLILILTKTDQFKFEN